MTARKVSILLLCVVGMHSMSLAAMSTEVASPRAVPVVAIFSGHTDSSNYKGNHRGCISASDIPEFRYNDAIVDLLGQSDEKDISYMVVRAGSNIPFQHRPLFALKSGASAMVEIHHDSVQPHIYEVLTTGRADRKMLDFYRGFSVHIYPRDENIELARQIEDNLISAGIPYSVYHQENIPGEAMKPVDGLKATYERPGLFILRNSMVPTAIIECGCVANPEEDNILKDETYRKKLASAISRGLTDFLATNQKRESSK